jgi:diguanylate cyclase (GGDEF)-like protein
MSGLELLKRVRTLEPSCSVIVVGEGQAMPAVAAALREGASDYLVKPFAAAEPIVAAVRRVTELRILQRENRNLLESLRRTAERMGKLNNQLAEQAIRDGLTGLYNHRYFQQSLTLEIARCERHRRHFSLVLADVDFFKQYNDRHGHLAGDTVLRVIGEILQGASRSTTIVARYGGEEFALLVPETDNAGAHVYAEKLRERVEAQPFVAGAQPVAGAVTLSLGVATFPDHGSDRDALIAHADQALYRAKRGGRNQVCG